MLSEKKDPMIKKMFPLLACLVPFTSYTVFKDNK